jgi:predicted nucleic acid-binding Zn finger protein
MSSKIAKVWTFSSSSSSKEYETLLYTDGSTSCNCPGWTRRVAADGSRSCKHTRMVHQGIADSRCDACADYTTKVESASLKSSGIPSAPMHVITAEDAMDGVEVGVRRFNLG